MTNEDVTLGEVYRVVTDVRQNMVTKETNAVVIESLRIADRQNSEGIKAVAARLDEADKDIKAAGRTKVNMFIAAGLAVVGSVLANLFIPPAP